MGLATRVLPPGAWAAATRALASDGADHVGAVRLAYSRSGIGSDRVASSLMDGSYSGQFNSPIGNQ
ncbi:Hemagglutinin [Pseudomonas sp. IT-P100]